MSEHKVASLSGLEQDVPVDADVDGTKIVLVRRGDTVHALAGLCPHRGVPLSKGIVDGGAIVCGVHRAAFSLETGEVLAAPACESLARHDVRIDGDDVHVTLAAGPAHPVPEMAKRGTDARRFVIVGSGAAGWRAAETLRRSGFEGAVTVVTNEGDEPYDRTELSKSYLKPAGEPGDEPSAPVLRERAAYEAHDIDVVVARAAGLDTGAKRLRLADGPVDGLDYDALLIATGSDARRLDVPGADLDGVHVVRTLEDAQALRKDLDACRKRRDGKPVRAAIVGGGFVGLEAATSLSAHDDVEVTVVLQSELPMAGLFGDDFAARLKREHEGAGVRFCTESEAKGFAADGSRVGGVELAGGETVEADLVVVAIGAAPRTAWLPFDVADDGGIAVDEHLAVPGSDAVWLAGDIARVPTAWGNVRIEHWRFAQECGEVAARNMLGGDATYEGTPFFWSAQQIQGSYMYTGHAGQSDESPTLEGDASSSDFALRFVEKERITAVLSHGIDDDITRLVPRMAGQGGVPTGA